MKQWIKLYTEALHDRKMRKISRFDKSVFYDLLLLAGQEDKDGNLPEIDDIALELDLKVTEAKKSVTNLLKAGLLTEGNNGDLIVTHYKDRQESNPTGAEKTARYRERLQKSHNQVTDVTEQSHNEVTNEVTNVTEQSHNEVTEVTEVSPDCNEKVTPELRIKNKNKNKIKELNNICADAQNAPKGNPDDFSYWQKTFGPRAEMAHAFHRATGITPIRSEFGRWQNDLKDFAEAGITIQQMEAAVMKIRAEGRITIGAPGSVFKTARDIAAGARSSKSVQSTKSQKQESWVEIAERISQQTPIQEADAITGFGQSEEVYDL